MENKNKIPLLLTPAFYYKKFKSKRNVTNDPEFLVTRIEGWMVSLGVSIPAYMEYSLTKETEDEGSSNQSGKLFGYTIMLTGSVFLGI